MGSTTSYEDATDPISCLTDKAKDNIGHGLSAFDAFNGTRCYQWYRIDQLTCIADNIDTFNIHDRTGLSLWIGNETATNFKRKNGNVTIPPSQNDATCKADYQKCCLKENFDDKPCGEVYNPNADKDPKLWQTLIGITIVIAFCTCICCEIGDCWPQQCRPCCGRNGQTLIEHTCRDGSIVYLTKEQVRAHNEKVREREAAAREGIGAELSRTVSPEMSRCLSSWEEKDAATAPRDVEVQINDGTRSSSYAGGVQMGPIQQLTRARPFDHTN